MITNIIKNKIPILFIIIIILLIYSLVPKNNPLTTYQDVYEDYVYLLNDDTYLVRKPEYISSKNVEDILKEKISYLIVNSSKNGLISNGYKPIIPIGTKIIDLKVDNNIVKINFSKELLNINPKLEESMLEAIIYTLTENNEINEVMIFVEGNILNELPNSKTLLPPTLKRDYGINKTFDLSDYKNTNQTIVYFINDDNNYIPVTFINNSNEEKIEIIINELKSNSLYQSNLISFLKANTILEDYEITKDSINLSFNQYIFDDFDHKLISEEVKYAIYLSIKDTYNIKEVNYLYHDELISKINKI